MNKEKYWILTSDNGVTTASEEDWIKFLTTQSVFLRITRVGDLRVWTQFNSTSFDGQDNVLFTTYVEASTDEQRVIGQYSTYDDAVLGHTNAVRDITDSMKRHQQKKRLVELSQ